MGFGALAGLAVAGWVFSSPAALANEGTKERSSAGGPSHQGSSSMGGASSSTDHGSSSTGSSATGSEARGSGQAGTSTGARPGEVTGSTASGGTSQREAAKAAEATHEVSGKVEKFDRQTRTLSLADSDKKLKVTDDTQVMKDGTRVSPGQIMEGDEVRASYSGAGDEVEVVTIELTSPASDRPAGSGSGSALPPPPTGGTDKSSGSSIDASSGSTGTTTPAK
jgi:hypothetical protein